MEVFINERSMEAQFYEIAVLEKALLKFLGLFSTLNRLNDKSLQRDGEVLMRALTIKEENLFSTLRKVNREIREQFYSKIFDKGNCVNWRDSQVHSLDDNFIHKGDRVTDSSLAEVCERKLRTPDSKYLIFNICPSKYSELKEIRISKNDLPEVITTCFSDETALGIWLSNEYAHLRKYDINTNRPPRDFETILINPKEFTPHESYRNHSRRVFVENATGNYWVVDNASFGRNAQIEVFDRDFVHIGISDINQNKLDRSKKRNGRILGD
jgi:hypothetical protein